MEYTARLPTEVADALELDSVAARIPQLRNSGPLDADLIIVAQTVATLVTLTGTPAAIRLVADRLMEWWRRRLPSDGVVLRVNAKGPGGNVDLRIKDSTTVKDLEDLIKKLVSSLEE